MDGRTEIHVSETGHARMVRDWARNGSPLAAAKRYAEEHALAGMVLADGRYRRLIRRVDGRIRQETLRADSVRFVWSAELR
jgi:hypothetical protein